MRATLLALSLALAGCVTDPSEPPKVPCTLDTDCTTGQTCRDNQCFGGSTDNEFAAELFAPANRTEMLARAEIKMLQVSQAGDVDVMFARSVEVTGRVVLRNTDALSSAASVVFRRPSRIMGAPDYVVTVNAQAGKAEGEVSYRARLVPNEGDEKYEVSIYPDDGTLHQVPDGALTPDALAPPLLVGGIRVTTNVSLPVTLDSGGLRGLSGQVLDALGNGMEGMRVRAFRKRTTTGPSDLVSSTGTTKADGRFELYLPVADAALFDLEVKPGPGVHAPSLTRKGVRVSSAVAGTMSSIPSITYPPMPRVAHYQLPVSGADPGGGRTAAVGAEVTFSTTIYSGPVDTVTYDASATVSSRGTAEVDLVPGAIDQNRMYKVSAVPLPAAIQGARWDVLVPIGPPNPGTGEGGVLADLELPKRVQVTGRIIDAEGNPAANMSVRPVLASSFLADVPSEMLPRIQNLGKSEVTTKPDGSFTVYLDPILVTLSPVYDFDLVPPSASRLPRWSRDGIRLTGAVDFKRDLGDTNLPRTTLAMGTVRDEDGALVSEAEVRVYMRDSQNGSRLRTLAKSDKDGHMVLVLPSP